jgi:HlyD family secretion protein
VSGIIDELYVEPGEHIVKGKVLAKVKIIPDMVNLNSAESRVKQAEIQLEDARINFERQKELFEKEVISKSEFQKAETAFSSSKQELQSAKK